LTPRIPQSSIGVAPKSQFNTMIQKSADIQRSQTNCQQNYRTNSVQQSLPHFSQQKIPLQQLISSPRMPATSVGNKSVQNTGLCNSSCSNFSPNLMD